MVLGGRRVVVLGTFNKAVILEGAGVEEGEEGEGGDADTFALTYDDDGEGRTGLDCIHWRFYVYYYYDTKGRKRIRAQSKQLLWLSDSELPVCDLQNRTEVHIQFQPCCSQIPYRLTLTSSPRLIVMPRTCFVLNCCKLYNV